MQHTNAYGYEMHVYDKVNVIVHVNRKVHCCEQELFLHPNVLSYKQIERITLQLLFILFKLTTDLTKDKQEYNPSIFGSLTYVQCFTGGRRPIAV